MRKFLGTFTVLLLLLIAGITGVSRAQEQPGPLVLAGSTEAYPLGLYLEILPDPGGRLTIDQVAGPAYAAAFSPSRTASPNLGHLDPAEAVWLRFRVQNTTAQPTWQVALHEGRLGYLDLYYPNPAGGYVHKQTGTHLPLASRDVAYHEFILTLPLPPGSEQTVYLRAQDNYLMRLPLTLWQPDALADTTRQQLLLLGLLHGMLLVMAAYNLFLFFNLREFYYLYLAGSILAASFNTANRAGLVFQYLGPTLASTPALYLGFSAQMLAAVFFTQAFLATKTSLPRLHGALYLAAGLALLDHLMILFGVWSPAVLSPVIELAAGVLFLLTGLLAWRRGYRPARYYVAAILAPFVGQVLFSLGNWLPAGSLFFDSQLPAAVLMALLFSMALANRIHRLRGEAEAANRELRASQERLRRFLDAMPVGVTIYDQVGDVIYLNNQALQILHLRSSAEAPHLFAEVMARLPFYRAGTGQLYPPAEIPSRRALAGEKAWADDVEIRPAGQAVNIEAWAQPITGSQGQVQYVALAYQDITARRQAEAELAGYRERLEELVAQRTADLAAALNEAEAANRAKSAFLASMSHELRTPLNGILGYAQLFRHDPTLSPAQQQQAGIIEQSGRHLLSLIEDILDIARIEAGRVVLQPAALELASFVETLSYLVLPQAEAKGLAFSLELAPNLPAGVVADERRLRQILLNLLNNAIKFTAAGQVSLTVTTAGEGPAGSACLRFTVADTGSGIPADELAHIYQPFYQVNAEQYQAQGAGLGLAISQRLAQLMGSRLEATSQPGQGSTFWLEVTLPLALEPPAPAGAEPVISGYRGGPYTILVVDDEAINRAVLRDILAPLGFTVVEARDGQEGLTLAARLNPHLVLADLRMPGLDGGEMTRRLRQMAGGQRLPVIGISALAYEADRQQFLAAGGTDFLTKPVHLPHLLAALKTRLGLEWLYQAPKPPAGPPAPPPVDTLAQLEYLALRGDVNGLRACLDELDALGPAYEPFTTVLRRLVAAYKINDIKNLLEQYKG